MASDGAEFFTLFDDTATCGTDDESPGKPAAITRASIESVAFGRSKEGFFTISMIARHGTRQMSRSDVQMCMGQRNPAKHSLDAGFMPDTKAYRIDFAFDGHSYKVTPSTKSVSKSSRTNSVPGP
jgi:hypothetical protein